MVSFPLFSDPFTAEDFLQKLFPNLWSLLINLLALIVLFVLVYWIAFKPVKKMIDLRKGKIVSDIEEGERKKEEGKKLLEEGQAGLKDARLRAASIVEEAKASSSKIAEGIVKEAEDKARAIEEETAVSIKRMEEKSRAALEKEAIKAAIDASREILSREVTKEDEERLSLTLLEKMDDGE